MVLYIPAFAIFQHLFRALNAFAFYNVRRVVEGQTDESSPEEWCNTLFRIYSGIICSYEAVVYLRLWGLNWARSAGMVRFWFRLTKSV